MFGEKEKQPFHKDMPNVERKLRMFLTHVENALKKGLGDSYTNHNVKAFVSNFVDEIEGLCRKSFRERVPTDWAAFKEVFIPGRFRKNEHKLQNEMEKAARILAENLSTTGLITREHAEELCLRAVARD